MPQVDDESRRPSLYSAVAFNDEEPMMMSKHHDRGVCSLTDQVVVGAIDIRSIADETRFLAQSFASESLQVLRYREQFHCAQVKTLVAVLKDVRVRHDGYCKKVDTCKRRLREALPRNVVGSESLSQLVGQMDEYVATLKNELEAQKRLLQFRELVDLERDFIAQLDNAYVSSQSPFKIVDLTSVNAAFQGLPKVVVLDSDEELVRILKARLEIDLASLGLSLGVYGNAQK